MADGRRRIRGRQDENPFIKILRFGMVPFIVIILIIIILYMDRPQESVGKEVPFSEGSAGDGQTGESDSYIENDGNSGQSAGGGSDEQTGDDPETSGEEESQPAAAAVPDPSQYPFQQDAVLELTGLVQSYCEAKEECDPDLLAWVFGISDWSEEDKEEERARMELVKASVKSYMNISCYSIQGPEPDSYVIFPYYEIRYRETETLMPAFSWGYVRKDESGRFYMVQEMEDMVKDYIRKTGEKAEVKAVMAQILARQQEAIASDAVLQKIYGGTGESEVIIGGVSG